MACGFYGTEGSQFPLCEKAAGWTREWEQSVWGLITTKGDYIRRALKKPARKAAVISHFLLPRFLFQHPAKKRPALVWNTETTIQPEWDPAILQSLKADCSAPPSSSGLASTTVPSGTDDW